MDANLIERIEACKRGQEKAQRQLYAEFTGMMFGVALRYTNTRSDAEDVLQESWIKVFRHLQSFSQFNSFEGWLRRIVVNTAITHYRRNQKHVHHLDVTEVHATPASIEAFKDLEFTREELEHAMAQLPTGYGMVFKMYVIDGFKHKEIADQLGIDLNTSKSQLSRARRYLQTVLADMSKIAKKQRDESGEF